MARNVVELRPRRMPTSPPTSPHTWYEWSVEHDGAEIDVVESWSGSADGPSPSPHDAWLVLRRGPVLRLGAIDGATRRPAAPTTAVSTPHRGRRR